MASYKAEVGERRLHLPSCNTLPHADYGLMMVRWQQDLFDPNQKWRKGRKNVVTRTSNPKKGRILPREGIYSAKNIQGAASMAMPTRRNRGTMPVVPRAADAMTVLRKGEFDGADFLAPETLK